MKLSDVLFHLFCLAVTAATIIGALAFGAWFFHLIVETDLPAWVKYTLLK